MFDDQNKPQNSEDQSQGFNPPPNLPTNDQNDLPSSQPSVMPKPGRALPGTEDMFATVDRPVSPSEIPGGSSEPQVMPQTPLRSTKLNNEPIKSAPSEPLSELPDDLDENDGEGNGRKFFWIGLVALVIVLVVGGWYVYANFFTTPKIDSEFPLENLNVNFNQNMNENQNDGNNNLNLNEEPVIVPPIIEEPAPSADILDSDGDGLIDREEDSLGMDPYEADTDGDELFDYEEVRVYETDPLNPDTDGDGYLDGDEVKNGYDPKGPGRLLELNQ